MIKKYLLGVLNLLLAGFFTFILIKSSYGLEPLVSFNTFVHTYAPDIILLLAAVFNGAMAYRLLVNRKMKASVAVFGALTLVTIFWFLVIFLGYFFITNPYFDITILAINVGLFLLLKRTSKKLAISISVLTLVVFLISFIANFEEDYCWNKGTMADPIGQKMVVATEEDAKVLKSFGFKEGQQVGVSFKVHMLCHDTFDFGKALIDRYFPH